MPGSTYSSSSRGSGAGSRRSYTQHPILADLENAPNPFTMPSDEEVFVLREEERNRKLIERKQQQRLRVHEKTTWASRQNAATVKELVGGADSFEVPSDEETEEDLSAPKVISRAPKDRSETMSDFIAKKREMFLVQMSLNTKREEISKLEQKAQARDIALKESETMLEMDTGRFELFIRENDDKTMAAQDESRHALKLRNDADTEIKKLRHEITIVEREIQVRTHCCQPAARSFLPRCAAPPAASAASHVPQCCQPRATALRPTFVSLALCSKSSASPRRRWRTSSTKPQRPGSSWRAVHRKSTLRRSGLE